MKLSVQLTCFRAQETIDKVKNLLSNFSGNSELEIVIKTNHDPVLENVLKRYLPQDERITIDQTPTGETLYLTTDENISVPPLWDTLPEFQNLFVPIEETPPPLNMDDLAALAPNEDETEEEYRGESGEVFEVATDSCEICGRSAEEILKEHYQSHDEYSGDDDEVERIALLVPTRKRPSQMERLATSVFDTASMKNTVGVFFYIDNDDAESQAMGQKLRGLYGEHRVNFVVGERIVLSQCWNEAYKIAEGYGYTIFQHSGDDLIFRSAGWDTLVRAEFLTVSDRILFLFGDDGFWGHNGNPQFGTHGFVHKNWVETVGYFVPPYFSSDYNDTWLNDVAKLINRWRYNPEIVTEHMHWVFNKAEKDQTYRETEARGARDQVTALYERMLPQRREDATKLQNFISQHD